MTTDKARFEFRAFARDFGVTEARMRERSPEVRIKESGEVYLLSASLKRHNLKIRGDALDIKELLGEQDGLEQWTPTLKASFPLDRALLRERIAPLLELDASLFSREQYSAEALVEEVVRPRPGLVPAVVFKTRFGFLVDDCACEIADVRVNGAHIRTACVESTDAEAVQRLVRELHLDPWRNTSYLVALQQITGLAPVALPF